MTGKIKFKIDGITVEAAAGQTIIEAADEAGIYIPRLCYLKELIPHGSCRVCTVLVNGRPQIACAQPISEGMVVENDTPTLLAWRRGIVSMLFVEGYHFCSFCERSGNCELQAMAYRLRISSPQYPYLFNTFTMDATHPDVMLNRERCILCGRCVLASRIIDGKNVFDFLNRAINKRLGVNSSAGLKGTKVEVDDKSIEVCPVGALLKKRVGFPVPIGERRYDHLQIGDRVEDSTSPGGI